MRQHTDEVLARHFTASGNTCSRNGLRNRCPTQDEAKHAEREAIAAAFLQMNFH
jgi:hypothetical protein